MDAPRLSFDPHVDDFAGRSFTVGNSEITFEEAYNRTDLRRQALQFYPNSSTTSLPLEFTQFVLRKLAINERSCNSFAKNLPLETRGFLKRLIGRRDTNIYVRQHDSSENPTGTFQGVFLRLFFQKVIYNLQNEIGRSEDCENYATVFPFQVLKEVPARYDIEIINLFDEDFYNQIQIFLNDHFEDEDARKVTYSFLANVNHFKATRFSEEALMARVLRNEHDLKKSHEEDYLSSFPRLSHNGVNWFKDLYRNYKNVRKIFDNVDVSLNMYDDNYFQMLPENNFVDLYELLDSLLYKSRPKQYIERFKKYLFFFTHALKNRTNPVFFIDDVLFECLKSLHRFKICFEDVTMKSEIAMLSLVIFRKKYWLLVKDKIDEIDKTDVNNVNKYRIDLELLLNIKTYITKIPDIHSGRVDILYKTDYLQGWMLFRNHDTCYEMYHSRRDRKQVDDFVNLILCSVLPPDDNPIKHIAIYNPSRGEESWLKMPQDIESIRNFVRLSNRYDFVNDPRAKSNDEFLTRGLEMSFDHLTIANE